MLPGTWAVRRAAGREVGRGPRAVGPRTVKWAAGRRAVGREVGRGPPFRKTP